MLMLESTAKPMPRSRLAIFLGTLALLLLALGVVAPDLQRGMQRGKERRTMSDLRSIGAAVESYQVDHGFPPDVPDAPRGGLELEALARALEPTFIKHLPRRDAWGSPIQWFRAGDSYRLVSVGADREPDFRVAPGVAPELGPRNLGLSSAYVSLGVGGPFDQDLHYSDGQFTSFGYSGGCSGN